MSASSSSASLYNAALLSPVHPVSSGVDSSQVSECSRVASMWTNGAARYGHRSHVRQRPELQCRSRTSRSPRQPCSSPTAGHHRRYHGELLDRLWDKQHRRYRCLPIRRRVARSIVPSTSPRPGFGHRHDLHAVQSALANPPRPRSRGPPCAVQSAKLV